MRPAAIGRGARGSDQSPRCWKDASEVVRSYPQDGRAAKHAALIRSGIVLFRSVRFDLEHAVWHGCDGELALAALLNAIAPSRFPAEDLAMPVRTSALPGRYEPRRFSGAWPFSCSDWQLDDTPIAHRHRHEVLELGVCRAGSGTYLIEDKEFRFSAGDAVVIGPRELHWSSSDPGTVSQWTYLFADPLRLLAGVPEADDVLTVADLAGPDFPNLLRPTTHSRAVLLIGLLAEAAADGRPHLRAQIRGLLLALMAELHRLPGRTGGEVRADDGERLAPALQLIGRRFRENLGIPALARACKLGETTFRRAFHASFGHGPKEHLIRLRLAHAAARLRAGRPVTEAAMDAGFTTLGSFNRLFRARYGMAPRSLSRG